MGRSRALNVAALVSLVWSTDFRGRVLDLGIGNGVTAIALKNWCEWPLSSKERFSTIDGVEGFGEYRNSLWQFYDAVVVENVLSFVERLEIGQYDLVVMFDVLEHFDRETGEAVLKMLLDKFERVAIATPDGFTHQDGESYEGEFNELEEHRSGWTADDLKAMGMQVFALKDHGAGLFAVKWTDAVAIELGCERA